MKNVKVLVADDDVVNRRLVSSILEDTFQIAEVGDGQAVLDHIKKQTPDIILLDNVMPVLSGIETCRAIRLNPDFQKVKVLLLSGKTSLSERLAGYEAGADDYIGKPFDNDELLAKVRVFARLKQEEELNQLKTNFLSLINHETGTPLTAVIALSDMLLDDASLTNQQRSCIAEIKSAGQILNQKIERLLLLSSLKQSSNLIKHAVFVDDLVQFSIQTLQAETKQREITIDWKKGSNACIWADYQLLQKAVTFIVENAIRFSPKRSRVVINVTNRSDDCELAIQDEGPGLPKDNIETLFSEFAIGDIRKHNAGLGISLALSKLIMDLHNAKIVAENRSDEVRGAVFRFQWKNHSPAQT